MLQTTQGFLPTLWSRLSGWETQHLDKDEQVDLIKAEILQNIRLILNSRSHISTDEMNNASELQFTVLGFGLSDFTGKNNNHTSLSFIKKQILEQIVHFEPRLDPDSIEVVLVDHKSTYNSKNYIDLEIKAKLRDSLSNEIFSCVSKLDLDAGSSAVTVMESTNGS